MFTYSKTIIAGSFIEIYKYQYSIWYGPHLSDNTFFPRRPVKRMENGRRSELSLRRSKKTMRRLINANVWNWFDKKGRAFMPIFFTLTFAENITEVKKANYEFTKFIQRFNHKMKYEKSYLKYVVVIEFQQRGAIHYHAVFFNLPYVDNLKNVLLELWGKGFTNFTKIANVKNVGFYMGKYMTKNINDSRLYGQKCYFASKGLNKPKVINEEPIADFLLQFLFDNVKFYEKKFPSKFCGEITYRSFNLSYQQEFKNKLLANIQQS